MLSDWLIELRWWWREVKHDPVRWLHRRWCARRGHGPYWVDERTSFDMLWQAVRCQRCGAMVNQRSEPNPTWWAERQAAFRQEWEER